MKKISTITNSRQAYQLLNPKMSRMQEEVWAIALSSSKEVLHSLCLFKGTLDHCILHPRDLFRFLILMNASSFIVSHSHPGKCTPSCNDDVITRKLIRLSRLIEIPIEDHLILGNEGYYSYRDRHADWFNEFKNHSTNSMG